MVRLECVLGSVVTVAGICNSVGGGVFFGHASAVLVSVTVANIGGCQG